MRRSKSSSRWLNDHVNDFYVKKARAEAYRSRAVYKLQEIDAQETLLKPGMCVIDLGAAPGGWTQYISERLQGQGQVIALDCLPMDPLPEVQHILGDFSEEAVFAQLLAAIPKTGVDVIVSDMAPNLSGIRAIDLPRAMALLELALDLGERVLKPGGKLLMKVFQGEGFEALLQQVRSRYRKVVIRKPKASRARSKESYLLAKDHIL